MVLLSLLVLLSSSSTSALRVNDNGDGGPTLLPLLFETMPKPPYPLGEKELLRPRNDAGEDGGDPIFGDVPLYVKALLIPPVLNNLHAVPHALALSR